MNENGENCDCSIELILKTPFKSMRLKERLLILQKGKPTPDLNLKADFISAKRNSYTRHFNSRLYETLSWLCGCKAKKKLFCWPCLLFGKEETIWSTTGYSNLQNFGKREKRHESSSVHIIAMKKMKKFTKVFEKNLKSNAGLSGSGKKEIELHNLRVKKNRFAFKHMARIVGSLGKLGIDCHDSKNRLYSEEMFKLVSSYNTELKFFMLEKGVSIWSEMKQIPKALTECLLSEIKKEISQATYLSLILDGVTDSSNKDYVCVTLRYIRDNGDIVERLVRYWDTTSSSSTAFEHIQQVLTDFNCAVKVVAFSCDNSTIKPSEVGYLDDLREKIKKICKDAVFVHYYAHELVYISLQSVNCIEEVRLFIKSLLTFADFFTKSEKRLESLKNFQADVVFKCENPLQFAKWVFDNKVSIEKLLLWILSHTSEWDICTVSEASGLLILLRDFDFKFFLSLFSTIYPQYQALYQGFLSNITQPHICHLKMSCFLNFLSNTKENFLKHFCEIEKTTPRFYSPMSNAMFNFITEKDQKDYEKMYQDIIDYFSATITERFKNFEKLEFFCLLDRGQFKKHHIDFPHKAVLKLMEYYPSSFNFERLKNELYAIYSDLKFRSVYNLHSYISFQELEDVFPETLKLSRMLATMPLTYQPTSTSARIRDFAKNNCMSRTIFMKVEKYFLEDLLEQDKFLDKVVDKLVVPEPRCIIIQKKMKVLLQCGENKKIKDLADASELHDVIQQLFGLESHSYFLQKFNSEFEEFVDMEENEVISDKDKIKILPFNRMQAEASDQVVNYACNSLTFDSEIQNKEMHMKCEGNVSEPEDFIVLPPHTEKWPEVTALPISDFSKRLVEDLNAEKELSWDKEKWPEVIALPISDFSKRLVEDLNAEKELSWDKQRELIGHLANYAYYFKPYPNKYERYEICKSLVAEYPYLKKFFDVGGWEAKLLNKLKKMRQTDTSSEVKLIRHISKVTGDRTPRYLNINPKRGELNWAPDHLQGETIETVNAHKKFLIDESLKSENNRNPQKISALMSLTYSFRRELINNKISISELRKEYPTFFQEKEQFEEFNRLTAVCIRSSFFELVKCVGPKLYQLFIKKKKSGQELLFAKYWKQELIDMDELDKIKAETSLGLFALPYLLRENVDSIFKIACDDDAPQDECTYPTVIISGHLISGEYNVVAEGQNLCNSKNFVTAVGLLVSFFYTLSISYPSSIRSTLIFIQNCLLRIPANSIPPKVQTLMNKINNYVKKY